MQAMPMRNRRFSGSALFLLICLLFGGCASNGATRSPSFLDVAASRLPAIRALPHHPDSLKYASFTVTGGDTTLAIDSVWSPLEARKRWSATDAWKGGPIAASVHSLPGHLSDFATLESLDAVLAEFVAELTFGSGNYSLELKAPAERELERRLKLYQRRVSIDLCGFGTAPFLSRLTDRKIELSIENDAGVHRAATRIERTTRGSTFTAYEEKSIQYRCYTVSFRRVVNGVDIFEDATSLQFWVRGQISSEGRYYTWTLPRREAASAQRTD